MNSDGSRQRPMPESQANRFQKRQTEGERATAPFGPDDGVRIQRLLGVMDQAYFEMDLEGRLTFSNHAFCNLVGCENGEADRAAFASYLTADIAQKFSKAITCALQSKSAIPRFECTIDRRNGTRAKVDIALAAIRDPQGQPTGIGGIARDITDKTFLKTALMESEGRYLEILESAPYAISIFNAADGRYVQVNRAFCEYTGYSVREAIGRTAGELNLFIDPADEVRIVALLHRYKGFRNIETQFRTKAGRIAEASFSAKPVRYNGQACYLSIATDVTLFKEAQRALKESEQNYRTVVNAAPITITINRITDGSYLQVNPTFCERTGFSQAEVLGKRAVDLGIHADPSAWERMLALLRRDGQLNGLEMVGRRKDGGITNSIISARPITYKGERCMLFMSTNVDALKAAQNALVEKEKDYRTILNSSPYALTISRISDEKYIYANKAFYERSGYSAEEVIGNTTLDLNMFADPADRERMLEVLQAEGRADGMEIAFRMKNGKTEDVLVSARPILFKGESCLLFISTNISALKQVQRALMESEEKYRTILNTAPFSITVTRQSDGRYLQVNDSFCRNTGYNREEIIGNTVVNVGIYADPTDRQKLREAFYRDGRVDGMEIRFRGKTGSIKESLVSARPIRFEGEACILTITADVTALKATQRALEEREARYRTILEIAPYPITITRRSDNTFLEVNEAFTRRTGYSRDEALGRTPFDLKLYLTPVDLDRIFEILSKNGQVEGMEMQFRKKDGAILESIISACPIRYGDEDCLLVIAVDINTLKSYQRALKESEEGYRTILDSAPYSIVVSRLSDAHYMQVNEAFCRRTGYNRDEAVGQTPYDLNIFVDPSEQKRMLEIFYRDGHVDSMEVQFRAKDGRILHSLFSATPITYKGEKCLLAMTVDIEELKEAQKALRESEEKYRNILANIEEGYWEVDLGGNFTFVNAAEGRLHQCLPQELVGKSKKSFYAPGASEEVQKIFNQVQATGKPAQIFDYELKRQDGSTADIELSASLLKNASGQPIGFFGVSRDVTEKKRAEKELEKYRHRLEEMVAERTEALEAAQAELVKTERLAVLGQLTASVSHELRNPLGVIRSSNFYLQRQIGQPNEKIEKHFRRIEEQVDMCDTIVADLLEYTRGRIVSVSMESLTPWIEALLDQEQETVDIPIERHLSKTLPAVAHDREKMRRVLINLLNNAFLAVGDRQAAMKGNPVEYHPLVRVSTTVSGDHVVLTVEDNGIGMDKKTLQCAFEPLFTTRARGTGIGLANVKKIVEEHKGSITLSSETDKGTTVTIKLPGPREQRRKG